MYVRGCVEWSDRILLGCAGYSSRQSSHRPPTNPLPYLERVRLELALAVVLPLPVHNELKVVPAGREVHYPGEEVAAPERVRRALQGERLALLVG